MDFEVLDRQMRKYEQAMDRFVDKDKYLIIRLDGCNFTNLTKRSNDFEIPFDERFHEAMSATLKHIMSSKYNFLFGYTFSDEISLLFSRDDSSYGWKERKLLSIIAADVSVQFSKSIGQSAVFDSRLIVLPNIGSVIDYFRWRQADCYRNFINSHCYWLLRKQKKSSDEATAMLSPLSYNAKLDLLQQNDICVASMPLWQSRGIGMYFKIIGKKGFNPLTRQQTNTTRRVLYTDNELPTGSELDILLQKLLS